MKSKVFINMLFLQWLNKKITVGIINIERNFLFLKIILFWEKTVSMEILVFIQS